ncbi:hypothetical protein BDZ91DRAFT_757518 [Kalaharituber pfeilii]|nr:hypothetical protein BDZ91DRAFT_757518 [Kalaharituber pfeilii]
MRGLHLLESQRRLVLRRPRGQRDLRPHACNGGEGGPRERSRGGMPAGPRLYSPGWKVWNALLGLVKGIVRGCMLEERVFDEMLELCGGVLEAEEGRRVKEVM